MTAMVSVVRDGAVVNVQQLAYARNGKVARLGAIGGARYVLAEVHGGNAGNIIAKRIGKDLMLQQESEGAEPVSLIIEDFYGSEGQLVSLDANGEYVAYQVATAHGFADAAAMADGESSLITLSAAPSQLAAAFQFSETGASVAGGVLSGLAAVAGGFALHTAKGNGGKSQPAPAASSFLREDVAPAEQVDESILDTAGAPVTNDVDAAEAAAVVSGSDDAVAVAVAPGAQAPQDASVDAAVVEAELASAAPAAQESDADTEHAPEAGDSKNRARSNSVQADGAINAAGSVAPFSIDDVPVIDALMDDHGIIKGEIENGGYTDDGRPQIVGKAEPGVTVHVYDGVNLLGHAIAGANGAWSFTPLYPLADGRHEISIIHQHPNGDSGEESLPYVIIVDKVAAEAPVILGMQDDVGRITGQIGEQTITDDNRPTINGTAEALATVIIYDKGQVIGRVPVDAEGNWSFTPETALADGLHIFTYAAVDKAGNGGERSPATEFIVDTRPEKINIYYAEDDVGSLTDEVFSGGVTDDSMPTLFGTATAGGIVKIYEGSVLLGEVVADVDGTWQFSPSTPLSEGPHSLHATVTLVAKGESAPSKLFKLEVDLTAPSEPTIEQVWDDAGAVLGVVQNRQSTDDATPTLSGMAEVGSTVHIYDKDKLLGSTVADAKGEWVYTPAAALAEGDHIFTIAATDIAGNTTVSSSQYAVHIDLAPPSAPTIDSVYDDVGVIKGELQNGGSTDDAQPTFSGKAEAHSIVVVRDRGAEIGRVAVDENGDWSFTPAFVLSSGLHSISVVALDQAGNISLPSNTFDFSLQILPAVSPSITSIRDDFGAQTGELYSGSITDDTTPLISGRATPDSTVILMDNGVEISRLQVDGAGNWSFEPPQALAYGLHNIVVTEASGSASSEIFGFRVVEPNSGSGFEDFSTLAPAAQSDKWTESVLPSGLAVSGLYGSGAISAGTNDQSLRPEDAGSGIYLTSSGTIKFTLPSASSEVTFALNSYAPTSSTVYRIYFYDESGASLGTQYSTAGKSGFQRIHLKAPAGKQIGGFAVHANHATAQSAYIDGVQWGPHRLPSDISISSAETDDAGARIVYGTVDDMPYMVPDMAIQVSTEGGVTWANATFSEGSWALIQKDMPPGDWTAQVRIVELSSGLSLGLSDSRQVHTAANGAPRIVRIADAEGMYTAEKAADGSVVEISLVDTGAKVGDKVHISWGTVTYDHVLTQANINAGQVAIKVASAHTLLQGADMDFLVTAQIIASHGVIGAVSKPQKVIGTYTVSEAISDALLTEPDDNAYAAAGFKITTSGVMAVTGVTAETHAGLTLSDAVNANATFVMDKPVREISLRFSGIDSEHGVRIQFFDVEGNFIEEQTIHGNATALHANAYKYSPEDVRVDIGSFRIIANEPSVTLDRFTWKEVSHKVDSRDPAIIDSNMETFYGSNGEDVVTLAMKADDYFLGTAVGIHGGAGIDTLRIAGPSGTMVMGAAISSMELIELGGDVVQTVRLDASDVLRNGQIDAFYTGAASRVQMMVQASEKGIVHLSDHLVGGASVQNASGGTPGDMGDWAKGPTIAIDGVNYVSYQHSNLAIEVLVQQGANVTLDNRAEYKQYSARSLFKGGEIDDAQVDAVQDPGEQVLVQVQPEYFVAEAESAHLSAIIETGAVVSEKCSSFSYAGLFGTVELLNEAY